MRIVIVNIKKKGVMSPLLFPHNSTASNRANCQTSTRILTSTQSGSVSWGMRFHYGIASLREVWLPIQLRLHCEDAATTSHGQSCFAARTGTVRPPERANCSSRASSPLADHVRSDHFELLGSSVCIHERHRSSVRFTTISVIVPKITLRMRSIVFYTLSVTQHHSPARREQVKSSSPRIKVVESGFFPARHLDTEPPPQAHARLRQALRTSSPVAHSPPHPPVR